VVKIALLQTLTWGILHHRT